MIKGWYESHLLWLFVGLGRSYLDVWGEGARERLVYLTSDSENVLTELDNDKVGQRGIQQA